MHKILLTSFAITIGGPVLVTSSNQIIISKENQENINNLKQKYEEEIEKNNTIFINKEKIKGATEKYLYDFLNNQSAKNILIKPKNPLPIQVFSNKQKNSLKEKIKNNIETYKISYKLDNYTYKGNVNIYDNQKIEPLIKNYVLNSFSNFSKINLDNTQNDFDTIKKYLNLLKENSPKDYITATDAIAKVFNSQIQAFTNNKTLNYLNTDGWNLVKNDAMNEKAADYFAKSVNGWETNRNWDDFKALLIFAIQKLLKPLLETVATVTAQMLINELLVIAAGLAIPTGGIGTALVLSLVGTIIGMVIYQSLKKLSKEVINKLFDELFGKNSPALSKLILQNKALISKTYGSNYGKMFENYLNQGFNNGFWNKLKGAFGKENVKDRAVFLYNTEANSNWLLEEMKVYSIAKYRKWLPWATYKMANSRIAKENLSDKVVFYTATNATKGSWTGTYYGPVNNSKKRYYDLHWSRNFLEWTSLSITPKFKKISLNLTQSRFVTNTYSIAQNVVKLYDKNKKEIGNSFDSKTKNLVENLSKYQKNNRYVRLSNSNIELKNKEESFIKLFGEILN